MQEAHNVWYGGNSVRMGDRSDVSRGFKSEAQRIYGDRKVNCDHERPDRDCWERLYDDVVDGAGVRPDN